MLPACDQTCPAAALQHWVALQTDAEAAVSVVQTLVAAGADVNAKSNEGGTPLVSEARIFLCWQLGAALYVAALEGCSCPYCGSSASPCWQPNVPPSSPCSIWLQSKVERQRQLQPCGLLSQSALMLVAETRTAMNRFTGPPS